MPPLAARRNSLCLFCAFAARPHPQATRLGPRIQTANRSAATKKPRDRGGLGSSKTGHYNPLASANPFRGQGERGGEDVSASVRAQLVKLKDEFKQAEFLERLQLPSDEFHKEWRTFDKAINSWIKQPTPELRKLARRASRRHNPLEMKLRHMFYAQVCGDRFTAAELENQKEVADLRYPAEWYPATRQIPRTIHMHVGPTNSGKTYHALKRLEAADTGIYLGPLRLLAHEVYTRLNAKGKFCALVTGEEQRMPDGDRATMYSCTVEMAPLNTIFDVAVIDEIQMINHQERGWAWTQAFLGLQAREIHLCGEARTVPIMRELCALVGDEIHIHEYERLTPLQVEPQSLRGKLEKLEKGDCIVAFSIIGIHALRREIEKKTGKQCAIVYGSLPPETRAQQARLFNDPDNDYDFLVASDAIGMGLNLAIKRVIFESTIKFNGVSDVSLDISEVKQIAGRAGRYKTAHQAVNDDPQKTIAGASVDPAIALDDKPESKAPETKTIGWVTTLDQADHDHLRIGMKCEPEPIKTAGLFPPSLIVERFSNYFPPGTPFSYIMLRLHEISEIHPRFHLCSLKDQLTIADCIHRIKNLSVQDRITICAAPINMRNEPERLFLRSLAQCIADGTSGNLLDMDTVPLHVMDQPPASGRAYLNMLENLHKMLVCYLWLSFRFPNVLTSRKLANYAKKLVEDRIEKTLTDFSFTEEAKIKMKKRREKARQDIDDQGEMDAAQDTEEKIHHPSGMPSEVQDIINDARALNETAILRDDANEYPDNSISNGQVSVPERARGIS